MEVSVDHDTGTFWGHTSGGGEEDQVETEKKSSHHREMSK
jgi:hypothetical protein